MPKLRIHSDWSKVKVARGINPAPTKPSPFLETDPSFDPYEWWRDRAVRSAMEERFNAFTTPQKPSFDSCCLQEAEERVFARLKKHVGDELLHPAKFSEIWAEINPNATSGYPLFRKKRDCREQAFRDHARLLRGLESDWNQPVWPAGMGARCALRERPENKPRLVWVFPLEMTTLESRYATPLLNKLTNYSEFGWSFKWLSNGEGWHKWFSLTGPGRSVFNMDFSGYDSTVLARLIRDVFAWFENQFTSSKLDHNCWKLITEYFINTPIHMYDGVHQKSRGIPSGSYFTSILGSIVNLIAQEYFMLRRGGSRIAVRVLGDDSLTVWWNDRMDPYSFRADYSAIMAEICLVAHPDKGRVWIDAPGYPKACEIKFLGMNLVAQWPFFRFDVREVLAHAVWPEVNDQTPMDALVRLHGLVYAYGIDTACYGALATLRRRLLIRYPELTLSHVAWDETRDPEIGRYFRFVLGEFVSPDTWPSWSKLYSMYYGPPATP